MLTLSACVNGQAMCLYTVPPQDTLLCHPLWQPRGFILYWKPTGLALVDKMEVFPDDTATEHPPEHP